MSARGGRGLGGGKNDLSAASSDDSSYNSDEYDDGVFLGWNHSQRASQREKRLAESVDVDDGGRNKGDDDSLEDDGVYFPSHGRATGGSGGAAGPDKNTASSVSFRERDSLVNDKFGKKSDGRDTQIPSNSNAPSRNALSSSNLTPGGNNAIISNTPNTSTPKPSSPTLSTTSSYSSNNSLSSLPSVSTITPTSPLSYSIRIRLLLAVDLPLHLTPSTPLTPLFKIGLASYPAPMPHIVKHGLEGLPSYTRCSSGKILSVKDNGKAEWHEEMRWDGIKNPLDLSLVLELCCRSVSPEKQKVPGFGNSANTTTELTEDEAPHQRKSSLLNFVHFGEETNDVLPNVKALWRRGRAVVEKKKVVSQTRKSQTASDLEAASAAAAVAKFIMNEEREAEPSTSQQQQLNALPGLDEEEELEAAPIKKYQKMTDLRVGRLVIPLNELPLDEISNVAFVEKWYTLDCSHDIRGGNLKSRSAAKQAFEKKNPSVLLEISFSSSQYLDECEDELDDDVDDMGEDVMWDRKEDEGEDSSDNDDSSEEDTDDDEEAKFIEQNFGSIGGQMKQDEDKDDKKEAGQPMVDDTGKVKDAARSNVSMRSSLRMSMRGSFATQQSIEKEKEKQKKEEKQQKLQEEPVVEPGVVDFLCMVGAKDIGNQANDDGAKGWVNTNPECCILEQFPPSDDFHRKNDRLDTTLHPQVGWFCFPEGVKLWRGTDPPTARDLNLPPRDSSSSTPPNIASSIATFDACLNSTTSFSWFIFQSTSENYGSKNIKAFGVVIRFYVPAPYGVDPTQDDFAQPGREEGRGGGELVGRSRVGGKIMDVLQKQKRLWVPLGLCLISQQPIVGVLEVMLLRMCETLTNKAPNATIDQWMLQHIFPDIANAIINFQAPIPGVLHCSIPFLSGERLHLTLPPPTGLPALPHGGAVASVCRLLGAEGFTTLLAAVLTECKILLHSNVISNLAMVAEVMSSLIYPFSWALPYIPVLPEATLEMVDAPMSYMLGVPSCTMKWIDKSVLQEVVVIDLDNGFCAPDYFDGSRGGTRNFKLPSPLPATVSSNISKSVFRLLREEDEVEDQYFIHTPFSSSNHLPRLEQESLAEREFRISVAIQICGLVRGYQDCLFFVSASQPVFNRDRFLRNAPSLFEERRDNLGSMAAPQRILSPRSKRFLSLLINTQHFHQLLERLDHDDVSFFHEVMETFESEEDGVQRTRFNPSQAGQHLSQHLQKIEDAIPTYKVTRKEKKKRHSSMSLDWDDDDGYDGFGDDLDLVQEDDYGFEGEGVGGSPHFQFTHELLKPIAPPKNEPSGDTPPDGDGDGDGAARSLSVQYLVEHEKKPWEYVKIFETKGGTDEECARTLVRPKVTLRDAIGERRFRAWQLAQKERQLPMEDSAQNLNKDEESTVAIDLKTLLTSANSDENTVETASMSTTQSSDRDNSDREIVRRCLQRAYADGSSQSREFTENGRDLIEEAEVALRNVAAQQLLLTVLSQRTRLENERKRRQSHKEEKGHRNQQSSVSRLAPSAFECLVRLCNAMLESCMTSHDYEGAYRLLTHTAGFCTNLSKNTPDGENEHNTRLVYMTAKIGLHPIFADFRLWEQVMNLHQKDQASQDKQQNTDRLSICSGSSNGRSTPESRSDRSVSSGKDKDDPGNVEYEAAVSTLYEMLGYGVPAEELARFATRVSEAKGWFATEKGQALLVLARRLSVRRDEGDANADSAVVDLDLLAGNVMEDTSPDVLSQEDLLAEQLWEEVAWCHPTTVAFSHPTYKTEETKPRPPPVNKGRGGYVPLLGMLAGAGTASQPATTDTAPPEPEQPPPPPPATDDSSDALYPRGFQGRSPITSLANFGSSCVATGALDGSVFLAHTIHFKNDDYRDEIRGVRLEWGTHSNNNIGPDRGDAFRGAVSCLAGSHPAAHQKGSKTMTGEEEFMDAMEGCRIIAGTTGGALNVWNVNHVYFANVVAGRTTETDLMNYMDDLDLKDHPGITVGASTSKRLQYTLKGRALSGHGGGVTCIEVPSTVYRPDCLVSGGADGLIKLWNLRNNRAAPQGGAPAPTAPARTADSSLAETHGKKLFGSTPSQRHLRMQQHSDAQATLAGHGGRILCVRTAWHGDRLLSGGADRTVRLWDLAVSGGKCLQTLTGHNGWVTQAHYWGPHTIVSASTDRSVALWDARLGASPLFVLRYHKCAVSDLLLGSRTEPLMVSAGGDGTVATWDFRSLSNSQQSKPKSGTKTIRSPVASMNHFDGKKHGGTGSVLLSRGHAIQEKSVLTASIDGIIKEWEIQSGRLLGDVSTGHLDVISCLQTFKETESGNKGDIMDGRKVGGTITTSWDGTVRMRRLRLLKHRGGGAQRQGVGGSRHDYEPGMNMNRNDDGWN